MGALGMLRSDEPSVAASLVGMGVSFGWAVFNMCRGRLARYRAQRREVRLRASDADGDAGGEQLSDEPSQHRV
jgi:hypothetical protein